MKTLKDIADELGVSYLFEDWTRANIAMDGRRFADHPDGLPLVLDVLPVSGTVSVRNGIVRSTTERLVWFLDAIRMDSTTAEDASVGTRMMELAKRFIAHVNASGDYERVNDAVWRAEYALLDENVGGVCLEFTLTPIDGECEYDLEQ